MNDKLNFKKIPLFRILITLLIGILIAWFCSGWFFSRYKLIICLSALLFVLFLIFNYYKGSNSIFNFLLSAFLISFSIVLTLFKLNLDYTPPTVSSGIILDKPVLKTNAAQFNVLIHTNDSSLNLLKHRSFKAVLYAKIDSSKLESYKVGDRILFASELKEIKNLNNPDGFDYNRFMKIKGFYLTGYVDENMLVNTGSQGAIPLRRLAANLRKKISDLYESNLFSKESKALLIALTVGDRDFITQEMYDSFKNSGAIHVLAVSGLHVGIVFMVLNYLLKFMESRKSSAVLKLIIIISIVWFYAFLTGLSASVTRSALMFTLIGIGRSLNRDISSFNILFGAAIVMLLINPLSLFDVGFQLSFLAVGGIMYFQPIIYGWFGVSNRILDSICQLFSVSLAAQIITTPLTIYYFNQFPSYFWLTNLLIIPLVNILVCGSIVYISLSWIPILKNLLGVLINAIAQLTNSWVDFIDSLPGSVWNNLSISTFMLFVAYVLIVLFTNWLKTYKSKTLSFLLASIIISVVYSIFQEVKVKSDSIIVYNVPGYSVTGVFTGSANYLIHNGEYSDTVPGYEYSIKKHIINRKVLKKTKFVTQDSLFHKMTKSCLPEILIKEKHIIYYTQKISDRFYYDDVQAVCLIISENSFPPRTKMEVDVLVLDSSNKYNKRQWWAYAELYGIKIHDVNESGAFQLEL